MEGWDWELTVTASVRSFNVLVLGCDSVLGTLTRDVEMCEAIGAASRLRESVTVIQAQYDA